MDYNNNIVNILYKIVVILMIYALALIAGKEIILFDSWEHENALNWDVHPGGWEETSFTPQNSDGIPHRGFSACSPMNHRTEVSNFLFSPFFNRKSGSRLYIQVEFTMRDCGGNKISSPSNQQCRETFELYYGEADSADDRPSLEEFIKIGTIAASQGKYINKTATPPINKDTQSIGIKKNGVFFAFQDVGACLMLQRITVFYKQCDQFTSNKLAIFPTTPTSIQDGGFTRVEGRCINDSSPTALSESRPGQPPVAICQASGMWFILDRSLPCLCNPGFQSITSSNGVVECARCSAHYFKSKPSNSLCAKCPQNSDTNSTGSTICPCNQRYYRAPNESAETHCTQPPSEIPSLNAPEIGPTSLRLSWKPSRSNGGRNDLSYRIGCDKCDRTTIFTPAQKKLNTTSVHVEGLAAGEEYKFTIFAENGVTAVSGETRGVSFSVRTLSSSTSNPNISTNTVVVGNLQAKFIAPDCRYTLQWTAPPELAANSLNYYKVVLYNDTDGHSQPKKIREDKIYETNYDVYHSCKFYYCFQVSVKVDNKYWGALSPQACPRSRVPQQPLTSEVTPTPEFTGIIIAAVVVFFFVVIIAIICFRRNRPAYCDDKQNGSEFSYNPYNHAPIGSIYNNSFHSGSGGSGGISNPAINCSPSSFNSSSYTSTPHQLLPPPVTFPAVMTGGGISGVNNLKKRKTYVDPHTYEDPNEAIKEFTRQIPAEWITIESVIGGGEFGNVCKGKLKPPNKPEITVAIKTLKPDATPKNRQDFLTEASIMGQFDHVNVIYLQGVVSKQPSPEMIVTEFMENGSLDEYLRNNDGKVTILQLVGALRGIAAGMDYLSEMGYVHRDLAARNILVSETLVCKVSDFGLSRVLHSAENASDGAYTTKGGKIPVRWTAPEAIAYRKFTSASDVWSYGVVIWEVVSFGEHPYWDWLNQAVIQAVDQGYRLPPPMDCPESIYKLMLACWQKERNDRPRFSQIVRTLDKLIRSPEYLEAKEPPSAPLVPLNVNPFMGIGEWLQSFNMERYTDNFKQAGYHTLFEVSQMGVDDLRNIGITLLGHQKKLAQHILLLQCQLTGTLNTNPKQEAFLV